MEVIALEEEGEERDFSGVWMKGQRALIYCAIMGLEDEGIQLLKNKTILAQIDEKDNNDYTALHHAANLGCNRLTEALIESKANIHSKTDQIASTLFVPGGRTALHLAAENGSLDTVKSLLQAKAKVDTRDWENEVPLRLARGKKVQKILIQRARELHGPKPDTDLIIPPDEKGAIQREKIRIYNTKSRRFKRLDISSRRVLHKTHIFPKIWGKERCKWIQRELLKVTSKVGWTNKRHRQYSTVDIPVYDIPSVHSWVRTSITTQVFPLMAKAFDLKAESLRIRDYFFVKYEAGNGNQSGLGLHRDGSLLSCNVLLNERSEFKGGGTVFKESSKGPHTILADIGDFVAHSGQLLHGGEEVSSGIRYIMVVFIDVRECY
ncbi:hypothetical protein AAMO2058_000783500 [Amorphochlora amoebiformis]